MTDLEDISAQAAKTINESIPLQSLLYDVDLLPEQLVVGTDRWKCMVVAVSAFRLGQGEAEGRASS